MIGATLKSWHSRAMRVVVEGVGEGEGSETEEEEGRPGPP